jgi:phosphatidylglycerophosphate synthase
VVGRILDPFVDKVIIGGSFIFLAVQPDSGVNAWMVITVIGREMFITSLRSFLESEGRDFSATWSGKLKMVLQCLAVAGSLLYLEYGRDSAAQASLAAGPRSLAMGSGGHPRSTAASSTWCGRRRCFGRSERANDPQPVAQVRPELSRIPARRAKSDGGA